MCVRGTFLLNYMPYYKKQVSNPRKTMFSLLKCANLLAKSNLIRRYVYS